MSLTLDVVLPSAGTLLIPAFPKLLLVLMSRDVLVHPRVSGTLVSCLGNDYKYMRTMRKKRRRMKKESMVTTEEKEHNGACSMGQVSF